MMHTTYLNSSSVSFRCRDSSFHLPNCFLDTRFEINPLLISSSSSFTSSCYSCCCCCCCANSYNPVYNLSPRINPSFLCNGLRQSTLIQFSPSKKLIFQGRNRQSCDSKSSFSSINDSDRSYYDEKIKSFKEKRKQSGFRKGRYACWALEDKKKKDFFSYGIDDEVEILLDLLTEDVGLENLGVKDRKKMEKKELHVSTIKKKVAGSVKKKCENKVENRRREEERESLANLERRKSGSSYYSVSSTGEFESENDVEIKDGASFFKGESSNEYKDDKKTDSYRRNYEEEIEENVNRRQEFGEEKTEMLKKNTAEKYYENQEWRKKSEKKLNEETSQHHSLVNTERNSQHHSHVNTERNSHVNTERNSQHHSYVNTERNTQHHSHVNTDQNSQHHLHVNTERNSQQHSEKVDRIMDLSQSRIKYQRQLETSETDDNKLNTSSVQDENRAETAVNISRQDEHRAQSNLISKAFSSSSSSLEARMKNSEESSTHASDRREEQLHRMNQLTTLQDSRLNSQQISDTQIAKTENTHVLSRQSDIRSKKQELQMETSGSTQVSGQQIKSQREERLQRNDQLTSLQDSRLKSQQILDTQITKTENTRVLSRQSDIRSKKQELQIETSGSTQVSGQQEERLQRIDQLTSLQDSRLKSQQISDTQIAENTRVSKPNTRIEKQELHQDKATTFTKTGKKTTKSSSFHAGMPKETSSSYKALRLIPEPSSQSTSDRERVPQPIITDMSSQSGEQLHIEPIHEHSSSQHSELFDSGAIVSADQQQKSSSQFVGEFVRKAKHELSSSSEVAKETETHEDEIVYEDAEQHELKSSEGSGNSGQNDEGTGPADEMWHETGGPESSNNGEPVKKSGRTLWNVIGDVVRMRWGPPTHTPKSGKAESNRSTSSEAWFSGHEPEDSNDDNMKLTSGKSKSKSKKEASKNTSPSLIQESSSSSSPLPAIRMRRSPAVKIDDSGSGKMVETEELVPKMTEVPLQADASTSGKMVKTEELIPKVTEMPLPADASTSGKMVISDEELKRRKFARIDQVSKDRFDEWEEAYNVENKQRKNDEAFMREALLEAKKGADFWEVPVGAVLVQDGKIIARGYNLVEELRDSTAHAEMICIREASKNLRSWRLSGTTLYVTLEPCAMCAGAILQARVDTVVWGAPNKLLGADGSWIRLFPDGDGGNGTDKPAAPVHPFHPNMTVRRGVLSSECADVMQQFFQLRRKKKTEAEKANPPSSSSSSLPIRHHHHTKLFGKLHDAFSIMFCL